MAQPEPSRRDSTSPTRTSTRTRAARGVRRAAQDRAGLVESRSRTASAASTTTATGWSPGTPTSRRSRGAARCSPPGRTPRSSASTRTSRATRSRCSASSCSTRTRRSTPSCARSSPAASPRARSTACSDELRERAERSSRPPREPGTGDFVTQVAVRAAAAGDRRAASACRRRTGGKIFDWSNQMISYDDPEFADADPAGRVDRDPRLRHADGRGRARRARPTTSSPS